MQREGREALKSDPYGTETYLNRECTPTGKATKTNTRKREYTTRQEERNPQKKTTRPTRSSITTTTHPSNPSTMVKGPAECAERLNNINK